MNYTLLPILFILLSIPSVFAQETPPPPQVEEFNITPDSPFYGLDRALDNLRLIVALTDQQTALTGIDIAEERIKEVELMIDVNKIPEAGIAQEEHRKMMLEVDDALIKISVNTDVDKLRQVIKIEKRLAIHEDNIEHSEDRIKIKIETKGVVTDAQKAMIDEILSMVDENTEKVEIKIDNEKGKIKIEIETSTGKTKIEIENFEDQLEDEVMAEIAREGSGSDHSHDDDDDDD